MLFKSKKTLIISIVLLAVILALSVTAVTYAVWTTIATANEELSVPVDEYNPSEKYIVWQGLDSSGNFTDTEADIVSYAVVGYDGLVAELIIPPTHHNATKDADLDVVKICVDAGSNYSKSLADNPIITSIEIPATVVEITGGACKNMPLLSSVNILGSAALTIGDLAFANCPYLSSANFSTGSRSINGTSSSYLLGSGYLVPTE